MAVDPRVIERIGQSLRDTRALAHASRTDQPSSAGQTGGAGQSAAAGRGAPVASILAQAATLYGAKRNEEETPPTGFDPAAATLFEALIEGAFLVANADGEFDADERAAFEQVVLAASGTTLGTSQLASLVAELERTLAEDGLEPRISSLAQTIGKADQQVEVLRVAALIAQVSGGVSEVELGVMRKLAAGFGLEASVVESSIAEAERVLGG
jgi:tellurite resistance protein